MHQRAFDTWLLCPAESDLAEVTEHVTRSWIEGLRKKKKKVGERSKVHKDTISMLLPCPKLS
jgi:hypothetical protein